MNLFETKKQTNAFDIPSRLVTLHADFTGFRNFTIDFKNSVLLTLDMTPNDFKSSTIFGDVSYKVNMILNAVYLDDPLSDLHDYIHFATNKLCHLVMSWNVAGIRIDDDYNAFNTFEADTVLLDNLLYCIHVHLITSYKCHQLC